MKMYRLRREGRAFGNPLERDALLKVLRVKLENAGGAYRLKRPDAESFGPVKSRFRIMNTLRWNLPRATPGDTYRVMTRADQATRGPIFSVNVLDVPDPRPIVDGPGTDAIDRIYAATHAFCNDKGWRVTDMGICANKPGQHSKCNAWDGGVIVDTDGKPLSADEIHRRIQVVADYLKSEGEKHLGTGGREGLPVLGVIVMSKFWSRESGGWHPYDGTPHVSHWHVSGFPSLYPGWL
jgi:hypothetical protein